MGFAIVRLLITITGFTVYVVFDTCVISRVNFVDMVSELCDVTVLL